jgi:hypothetical protein
VFIICPKHEEGDTWRQNLKISASRSWRARKDLQEVMPSSCHADQTMPFTVQFLFTTTTVETL